MSEFGSTLDRLAAVIASRKGSDPASSWSARLMANPPLAAKKLAEEAVETALAVVQNDRVAAIAESADLIYHWLVVLAALDIDLDEVSQALESREGVSGLKEKASRRA